MLTMDGLPVSGYSNLQIKSVADGGFASVTFNLNRKLDKALLATFTDVMVWDTKTGEQVGGGRLLEQGRNDDGSWGITCLGEGLASMQDRTTPVFYVDTNLSNWRTLSRSSRRYDTSVSTIPDSTLETETLLFQVTDGKAVNASDQLTMVHRLCTLCDMDLASLSYVTRSGLENAAWHVKARAYRDDLTAAVTGVDDGWETGSSTRRKMVVVADFTDRQVAAIQWTRESGSTATEDTWSTVRQVSVRSMIYNADGTIKDAGYFSRDTFIWPHEVIIDWVVRYCPRLDANAGTIDTSSVEPIEQMAYIDGVHGMQVAEDVKAIEPAFRWAVWEQGENGKWPLVYEPIPTEVRYEASTEDGFSAPSPTSEVFNRVTVTGKTSSGRDVNRTFTQVIPELDDAGVVREATIPLGSEVWSSAAAQKVGEDFLAEHKVAPNAGTVTIARRVLDRYTGRWVEPQHIRAGYVIRLRGVQASPDSLNDDGTDGATKFTIATATYDDDNGSAVLELDEPTLTEARAIAKIARTRTRR